MSKDFGHAAQPYCSLSMGIFLQQKYICTFWHDHMRDWLLSITTQNPERYYCLFFNLILPQSCQYSPVDLTYDVCAYICNSLELLLSFALSVFLLFWNIVSNLALSSSGRKFTPKVSPVEVWQLYVTNKELYLSSTNTTRT